MAAIGEATPVTGKTNNKWTRLYLDTVDLSGDTNQIGSWGLSFDTNDLAGYASGLHYYQLGHAQHIFKGYQAVINNTALTGAHTELNAQEEYIASYLIGVNAVPEVGSAAWLSSMEQLTYNVQSGSDASLINVDLEKAVTDADHVIPFGVALAAGQALTANVANAGVDNLVATTNGFVAHLHVTVSDGGSWVFGIETSSDDGDGDAYANVATFTAIGDILEAERIDVAGAVARYIRLNAERTGGTCTATITIARGIDL